MNNRLQKKCFIAAAGFHLLMVLVLVVGPAFLPSGKKTDERPPIDFIPLKTIDEALAGGGNPNARPPAAAPQPPVPQPQPQPQHRVETPAPQPPQPVVQPQPKQATRATEVVPPKQARKLPEVSLKRVTRSPEKTASKSKTAPTAEARSQSAANERAAQIAKAAQSAARSIRAGSADSAVDLPELQGPGGGGVPYANFLDALRKIYTDAWLVPDGVTDDEATASASVTIAYDGTVKEARLIQTSGNALVDQSVQMTLRRVRFAVPLPDGAKESQRTVTIKFNVKAKRGLG